MKLILTLLISVLSFPMLAQGEANNWYFGSNAGISFNTSPPSALTNGQLNTNEGCSSISDANGNLLMYTDGRTIWNKNHQIMSNANYFNGTGLNGDPSSTSSGLIVPHPTNPNLYFIFTIDEPHHENANAYPNQGPADADGNPIPLYTDTQTGVPFEDDGFNNGLNYSIVDMSLNGGLGDVINGQRNNELITYDPNNSEDLKYKASEKITAVRGRDCNSVWVITHFKNKFYAFFIDDNGIDETPVISTAPPLLETSNYRRAALGYLKASPNADKLLVAHNTTNFNPDLGNADSGDGNVYAYDFDNLTGEVTSPIELISDVNAYGVEFSQDGTKVYASVSENNISAKIYQWNLNANEIPSSIVNIANIGDFATALQLGPDGKIYHAIINNSRLGVINNPNATGIAANYTQDLAQGAVSLSGRNATFGLPPFIQSLFSERISIVDSPEEEVIEQVEVCDVDTYTLSYDEFPGATYTWSRNGEVLPDETEYFLDIDVNDSDEFPRVENYSLEVDLNNGDCPLIGVAQVTFNQSPNYTNGELLTCAETDTAFFDLTEIITILADDTDTDINDIEVELYRTAEDAELENNPIEISNEFENNENLPSVFAKVSTYSVCSSIVEFELLEQESPELDTSDENLFYCVDNFPDTSPIYALQPEVDPTLYDFLWSTGSTDPFIEINAAGEYSVDISFADQDCFVTKTFIVEESEPVSNSEDILLCDTFQYTIENDDYPEASLTWLKNGEVIEDENTTSLSINTSPGDEFPISDTYTLQVDLEDGSCLITTDYNITFNQTPNFNSVELISCFDFEQGFGTFNLQEATPQLIEGISNLSGGDIDIEFYNTRNEALARQNEIQNPQNFENIDGLNRVFAQIQSFEVCQTLVQIDLFTFDFPNVDIEDEVLVYCLEDFPQPLSLNALEDQNEFDEYTYSWSTGETSSSIFVNEEATYSVEITNPDSECSFTKTFDIIESNIAEFDHSIERYNNRNTLEIIIDPSSVGEYEFALNEPEDFQESNTFENLRPGIYTVYVRDVLGCGLAEKTIGILGIMEFFTPNGDGINDVWQISGLLENTEEDILLQVYDRYGKIMKVFTNRDRGWDGTYNGKNMPTDDYWYKIRLTDGTVETGSFTLKR